MEQKIEEGFRLQDARNELKEVVTNPENYSLREEVKVYQQRLQLVPRVQREGIMTEITGRFEQMIDRTGRADPILNFPLPGSMSQVQTSEDNSIQIRMNNLSKENLRSFLPPQILDQLEPGVNVSYYYPIDRYQYELTYKGESMPMNLAFQRIQEDLEAHCQIEAELIKRNRAYDSGRESASGSAVGR